MTTLSLPSRSLPSSYFCAAHRSSMLGFFCFLFMSHASVWWECISYRCLNVLIVHAYLLEILIFASVVRNGIPVHHGTVCAGKPWEHSSTCQWVLPALFCCRYTNGTDCSAESLHQPFSGFSCAHCSLNIRVTHPSARSTTCADKYPCWMMDTAIPALHSKSSSWLLLLFWS